MFRKIKKRIRKRGMLMFEAVLMLATLTAVTFGMVTIMTGSFSNLAAAKDAGEAQQMGDLVVSLVKQKDYDKMDELISYAPASKPTSMDNFVGDSDLKGKYSFSVEQIGDEIDAGSLGSTDDSDSTDDEGAKVKIMKVAIHPQDNKNVELYSTQVPVMSTKAGASGASDSPDPSTFTSGNGYYIFPNGLIVQWGSSATAYGGVGQKLTTAFPIPFPHKVFYVVYSNYRDGGDGSGDEFVICSWDRYGFTACFDSSQTKHYVAFGY